MVLFGGKFPESFHRSPFLVVLALVPLAHKVANRCRRSRDEVSNFEGASSKINLRRKTSSRAGSDFCSRKTKSDVEGQENPGQALGDRYHFAVLQAPGDQSRLVQQSAVRSQKNPGHSWRDRLPFPASTQKTEVTPGAFDLED